MSPTMMTGSLILITFGSFPEFQKLVSDATVNLLTWQMAQWPNWNGPNQKKRLTQDLDRLRDYLNQLRLVDVSLPQ